MEPDDNGLKAMTRIRRASSARMSTWAKATESFDAIFPKKARSPTKKHHKQVTKAPTKARDRKTGIIYLKIGIFCDLLTVYLP